MKCYYFRLYVIEGRKIRQIKPSFQYHIFILAVCSSETKKEQDELEDWREEDELDLAVPVSPGKQKSTEICSTNAKSVLQFIYITYDKTDRI